MLKNYRIVEGLIGQVFGYRNSYETPERRNIRIQFLDYDKSFRRNLDISLPVTEWKRLVEMLQDRIKAPF